MSAEVELIPELSGAELNTVEALARETDVPVIEVANLYRIERRQLQDGATIMAYIPVVAARRVRNKLKHHH